IFLARYEASRAGAQAIEPEHLLLGVAREDKSLLRQFLPNGKGGIELLRSQIERHLPERERIPTAVELPLAPESKRVLHYAHEESDRLQDRHIGTEHLLLGLMREERSTAARVLDDLGVRLDAVRETLAQNPRTGYGSRHSLNVQGRVPILLGVENLLNKEIGLLKGARVGLVCNQASVDHSFRHVADVFHEHADINVTALFGPQHGIRGDVQDNMIETAHATDRKTGLRVYSLYSETREPTAEMLEDVDIIVFDLQDVGTRIYTFVYTMANCMRAAKKFGKKVIVCDRPNPINGQRIEGAVLDPAFASFVGQFPIATRHGMTAGELAQMFNQEFGIGCDLQVMTMSGWSRDLWYDQTDGPWVLPSPNMPTLDSATVFPGTVHLEGTQMSEGRGTTRPFELVGAPYIDAEDYGNALQALNLPGVYFRPCVFLPTFQKHAGKACGGVQIHVTNRATFKPAITGIAIVKTAFDMYRDDFRWKDPPYEYEYDRNPFDLIAGTDKVRESIERGTSLEGIEQSWQPSLAEFDRLRAGFLLY
ncbi:MAG TPA: exo-beta-N-acetylmuramidase NamZ domain-containing protein, partial [Pyrinomonadaceae bacterium]|nr:exo-beta-N-acetylmuramidase NamZ domain-containing protein [Pyrinomonadaceae bacterium]